MASLPPISQDGSLDTFSASLAGYRSKALGRRKIRTREVASEPLQLLTYRHEMTTGKFGPRTPLTVPKSLLASSLSQRDLALMSERFSLSRCKQRGGSSAVIPAAIRSSVPVSPIREEEIKERRSGQGAELADFASRLKNANPIMLFCTKVLGEGHRPEAREGGSFTAINRKLYLFGGRCRRLFNDVKVLDPTTLRWDEPRLNSTLGGLPEPRVNHTAVAYQSQLIVYGGCERFNDILQIRNCFPLIHIYETGTFYLESNTWTSAKPLGRSPEPRRCHSAVIVGKVMFFFGGMDRAGKVLDDLEAINLGEIYVETMSWLAPTMVKRTIKPGPRAASSFTAVFSPEALSSPSMDLFNPPKAYDEVFTPSTTGIYLLSGLNDKGEACNDVHVLKVKKMSVRDDRPSLMWVKPDLAGTPPESRYDHSACLCGKCVYIYGGRNDSLYGSKGKIELNSFGILNIESQRWDRVELLGAAPSGRWSHSMASVDTKLFIFGGMKLSKFCSSVLNILETDQTITQDKAATLKDTKGKLNRKPTLIRSTVKRSTIFKREIPTVSILSTMDPFSLSSELPPSHSDWLRLEYPLPDVQISIKTVQKTCQGPFLPAHRLPHKHNLFSRCPLPALKTREKAVLLPYLYSTLPQCPRDRIIPRKSPRAAEGYLKRGKIGENRSMLLRGNSVEVDGKLKQVVYHKHSLSSICQPITLKVKCDFSRGKLPKKASIPPATPNITFTSTDIFDKSAVLKGNKTPENRKFSPEKQDLLTADFSSASVSRNRSILPLPKSSKSTLSSASDVFSEPLAEDTSVPLTPFHCLIDINASLESKAYGYLHRTRSVAALAPAAAIGAVNVKAVEDIGAKCTCVCPLHRRNITLFSLRGLSTALISPSEQLSSTIECVIRPVKPETTLPVLLIHLEGVLFTCKPRDIFANSTRNCYMRPGTVEGLHLLANSFELVFISDFDTEKRYKILEFLLQKQVQFYAVYAIKSGLHWRKEQEYCLQYAQIVADLGPNQPAEEQIALLCALNSEISEKDESCLYTCTGLGVRLHARYLPVVLPTQSEKPMLTFLVQHISSEDHYNSLLFTTISLEICKLHSKGWHNSPSPSPFTHFFLTKRIHEAYFSSLLPPLMSETLSCYRLADIGDCRVHRGATGLGNCLAENKLAIIHSEKQRFRAKLEIVDLEMALGTGKQATLLDFATVIE